jgi:hypothetical protein
MSEKLWEVVDSYGYPQPLNPLPRNISRCLWHKVMIKRKIDRRKYIRCSTRKFLAPSFASATSNFIYIYDNTTLTRLWITVYPQLLQQIRRAYEMPKYFKEKLSLPSSLVNDRSTANLDEREMMLKHLEDYRKGDKMAKLFSPITGSRKKTDI